MPTSKDFIDALEHQLRHIPAIRTRAMFGEYALYYNEVVVGLICDETIYIKITEQTTKLVDPATEKGPPYVGAKDQYIIDEKLLQDQPFIKNLLIACSEDVEKAKKVTKKRSKTI
ncbi:MAG: TfoX/Sxy family protein [Candidatus Roizmanbacteria bacterium]